MTYKDGHGEATETPIQMVPTNSVKAADDSNSRPSFVDSTPEWVVSEDVSDPASESTSITITDDADGSECDILAYELSGTDHDAFTHTGGEAGSPVQDDGECTYTVTISLSLIHISEPTRPY